MKRLFFKYPNVIPNLHFILELINIVLILGIVMGTNLAPILANIYMAMLEEELYIKCIRKTSHGLKCTKDSSMTDSESLNSTKNNFLDGLMNLTSCRKYFYR